MKAIVDQTLDLLMATQVISQGSEVQEITYFPRSDADLAFRMRSPLQLAKPPDDRTLTNSLINHIDVNGHYINITLNCARVAEQVLADVEAAGNRYGYDWRFGGQQVAIEHTSINPVYPINVATFRSSAIGNALARLFASYGASVETHFWVEDMSRQLLVVLDGLRALSLSPRDLSELPGKSDHTLGIIFASTLYCARHSPHCGDIQLLREMFPLSDFTPSFQSDVQLTDHHALDAPARALTREICLSCVQGFEQTFKDAGISVDVYDFEAAELDSIAISDIIQRIDRDAIPNLLKVLPRVSEDRQASNYLLRNVAYYWSRARRCSRFISVVPQRQRSILEQAALMAQIVSTPAKVAPIDLVFFGDVSIAPIDLDTIAGGVFHSVDYFLFHHSDELKVPVYCVADSLKFALLRSKVNTTCHLRNEPQTVHRDYLRILHTLMDVRRYISSTDIADDGFPESDDLEVSLLKYIAMLPSILQEIPETKSFHKLAKFTVDLSAFAHRYVRRSQLQPRIGHLSTRLLRAIDTVLTNALFSMGIDLGKHPVTGVPQAEIAKG